TLLCTAGNQPPLGTSAADGYYNIIAPSDGNYVLVINAAGAHPVAQQVALDGTPFELSLSLTADTADTADNANNGISPTDRHGVTVTSEATGSAVRAAMLTVIDSHGAVISTATTDEAGSSRITELAPGEYTLVADAAGCLPTAATLAADNRGELAADVMLRSHVPQHSPQ